MQPRSGHYKPPASSFRAFVHSLQTRGVDMAVLSVPRSYAVLLGMEGYSRGKQNLMKIKKAVGVEGGGDGDDDDKRDDDENRKGERGQNADEERMEETIGNEKGGECSHPWR